MTVDQRLTALTPAPPGWQAVCVPPGLPDGEDAAWIAEVVAWAIRETLELDGYGEPAARPYTDVVPVVVDPEVGPAWSGDDAEFRVAELVAPGEDVEAALEAVNRRRNEAHQRRIARQVTS